MSEVLVHQQSFDFALSRTVSTLIDWFPAGPLSSSSSAPPHHQQDSSISSRAVPTLDHPPIPRGGGGQPPRRSSTQSLELPLAPKSTTYSAGTITPRGPSTSPFSSATPSSVTPAAAYNHHHYNARGMGTPPISGSFGGESTTSVGDTNNTALPPVVALDAVPPTPPSTKGWSSWVPFMNRSTTTTTSAFNNSGNRHNSNNSAPLLPPVHFHSLISSLATATLHDSTTTGGGGASSGGFVVRAGIFTGLRLYASDGGGAIKMFSSLVKRCSGGGGGGSSSWVSPMDIGAAPVIQLRASVRTRDSVNAAGVRLTLQDSGVSSLDLLITAGRPRYTTTGSDGGSSSETTAPTPVVRPVPFYTHLCRFDKFLVTNYGMFNLYESSTQKEEGSTALNKAPILRRLRAGFGLVVRTEKNGLNVLWGFCAEMFKSLIVAFHADVIRRWCVSCCSANTLGVRGLDVGVRLRINLISYQNTILDIGIRQCIPLIVPSTFNADNNNNRRSPSSSSSSTLYRLGSWNWRLACNSYGVAVGGSLDDTDVSDLIRAVSDIVGGGDAGRSTLFNLGQSLVRPVPTTLRRYARAVYTPVVRHLTIPEDGRLRKIVDLTCDAAGLTYYVGVSVPLYCTAITSSLSFSGVAALYHQARHFGKLQQAEEDDDDHPRNRITFDRQRTTTKGDALQGEGVGLQNCTTLFSALSARPLAFWEVRKVVGEAVRGSTWVAMLEGSRVDVTCGITTRLSLPSIMEYVGLSAPDLGNGLVNYFNSYSVVGGSSSNQSPTGRAPASSRPPPLSPQAATTTNNTPSASPSVNRPTIRGLNCFVSITFS